MSDFLATSLFLAASVTFIVKVMKRPVAEAVLVSIIMAILGASIGETF